MNWYRIYYQVVIDNNSIGYNDIGLNVKVKGF